MTTLSLPQVRGEAGSVCDEPGQDESGGGQAPEGGDLSPGLRDFRD